jgi:hypothetical protein
MKETAVGWLLQQLFETNNNTDDVKKMDINKISEQAKEIEKQYIKDAFIMGINNGMHGYKTSKEYYNETFKNK